MEPIARVKNWGHALLDGANADLEAGIISQEEWHARIAAVITPAYLAGDNPRAQSGHSGDALHWERARSLIMDAVDRDGSFLDVGCANGHLMECVAGWAWECGRTVEPSGLDIAPELAGLACRRLPRWADRIYVGNALDWRPPRRFQFVRTGLEYVPPCRQAELLHALLGDAVSSGGRLIVGTYNEERDDLLPGASVEEQISGWGFKVAGRSIRPHFHDSRLLYKVLWIDA